MMNTYRQRKEKENIVRKGHKMKAIFFSSLIQKQLQLHQEKVKDKFMRSPTFDDTLYLDVTIQEVAQFNVSLKSFDF